MPATPTTAQNRKTATPKKTTDATATVVEAADTDGIVVDFEIERETKGTWRYKEVAAAGSALIGTLYIKKSAFDGEPPNRLVVTITVG